MQTSDVVSQPTVLPDAAQPTVLPNAVARSILQTEFLPPKSKQGSKKRLLIWWIIIILLLVSGGASIFFFIIKPKIDLDALIKKFVDDLIVTQAEMLVLFGSDLEESCVPGIGDTNYLAYIGLHNKFILVLNNFKAWLASHPEIKLTPASNQSLADADLIASVIDDLYTCSVWCTQTGTATWDGTECTCTQGLQSKVVTSGLVTCTTETAETQRVQELMNSVDDLGEDLNTLILAPAPPKLSYEP